MCFGLSKLLARVRSGVPVLLFFCIFIYIYFFYYYYFLIWQNFFVQMALLLFCDIQSILFPKGLILEIDWILNTLPISSLTHTALLGLTFCQKATGSDSPLRWRELFVRYECSRPGRRMSELRQLFKMCQKFEDAHFLETSKIWSSYFATLLNQARSLALESKF